MGKNRRNPERGMVLKCTLIFLCAVSLLFFLLLGIDCFHTEIDGFFSEYFSIENYFRGEVWFSVVATCIAAVPGVICGVLALFQAKRIHELEARYHRPNFGMEQAVMEVTWIQWPEYKSKDRAEFRRYVRSLKERSSTVNILKFSFQVEVKNDIEVSSFALNKVSFFINGKTYRFELKEGKEFEQPKYLRKYKRMFENGKCVYSIDWDLEPYILQTDSGQSEKSFWNDIEQFTNYENHLDAAYREIETKIGVKISYEYADKESEEMVWKLYWDARNGRGREGATATRETVDAYFTYE